MAKVRRSKKAPKDSKAPKKNLSAYFLFTQDRRAELKAAHPEKKLTQLTTVMAAEWKVIDAELKAKYQKQADADKAEYVRLMAEYKKTDSYASHQVKLVAHKAEQKATADKKAATKPKDKNAPKKPQTAYFIFTGHIRPQMKEENPDMKVTELAKIMGGKWKALNEEDKKQWYDQAAKLKAAHTVTVAEYAKSDLYREYQTTVANWQAEQAQRKMDSKSPDGKSARPKVSMPRKPKDQNHPKRALSSYMLFSASVREQAKKENPDMKITQLSAVLGAKWKAIGEEEKMKWSDLAAKQKEEYKIVLAQYQQTEEYRAFEKTFAEYKAECEKRQTDADAKYVKKMQEEMESGKKSKSSSSKSKGKGKGKENKHTQKATKNKKCSRYSDSESDSESDSGSYSSGSESSSGSGSYSSSSYSD